jgi:predicted deacetylase
MKSKMITSLTFDDVSPEYLTIEKLREFLRQLGDLEVKCTLFVVPTSPNQNQSDIQEFSNILKMAHETGHELGQHGFCHAGNGYFSEFGSLIPLPTPSYQKQHERIQAGMEGIIKSTGVKPVGFRAPYYLHSKRTLKALSDLGFRYDASKTLFKPAHSGGLRFKTMSSSKPFHVGNLIEMPTSGDYTLTHGDTDVSLKVAMQNFELVKKDAGVFVLNSHPNKVDLPDLFAFLKLFIEKVRDKTEFMPLDKASLNYA